MKLEIETPAKKSIYWNVLENIKKCNKAMRIKVRNHMDKFSL